ncbi:MAG: TMEM175 family protein [Thermoanaerobaculia bacterium]|nr:TMEM175 family protein [Thermoanaerobaculia bacterium]
MLRRDVTYTTERLGALSDGVFAIILTLLVLELKIPELPAAYREQQMITDLEDQVPNFVAWIISFILVARIWIVHHGIIARLARCHVGTITLNFLLLGFCSLVPFGAGLIGTYEWDPLAITTFSAIFAATGVSLGLLARHVAREVHLHREDAAPLDLAFHWKYHAFGIPGIAVLSVLMIPVEEVISLGLWIFEPALAFAGAWKRGRD